MSNVTKIIPIVALGCFGMLALINWVRLLTSLEFKPRDLESACGWSCAFLWCLMYIIR